VKDTRQKGMNSMNDADRKALVAKVIEVMGDASIDFSGEWFSEMGKRLKCEINSGATRRVFVFPKLGVVIKFPCDDYNYCEQEVEYYESAKTYGVEKLLLPIEKVGVTKGGIPLYIQPIYKFTIDEMSWKKQDKVLQRIQKTRNFALERAVSRSCYYAPNRDWLARAIQIYGKKFMRSFEAWTNAHHVNDLHSQNVGYIGNFRPVLIDYAGYNNW
jgi:hypothetical protein